jgi:hypothetical protein
MKFFQWLRERLSRKTITMTLDPELIELEKNCTVMTGGGGRKYTREMAKRLAKERFEKAEEKD